jgi:hypothetical protein
VRVTNIRCHVGARRIDAEIGEIPIAGLERSLFHSGRPNESSPLRREISAGYLTTFSDHAREMGYGGWSLFFAPEVVAGFASVASDWPAELDAVERYNQALRFLIDRDAYKASNRVFPD